MGPDNPGKGNVLGLVIHLYFLFAQDPEVAIRKDLYNPGGYVGIEAPVPFIGSLTGETRFEIRFEQILFIQAVIGAIPLGDTQQIGYPRFNA
jgi:hypothetical protein